jgi:serine/threonine protein kinase
MSDRDTFKSAKQSPLFGSADTLVGKKIDRFEILAQLGEGSLSSVYRAQDTENGTQVVLKIIHKHLLTSIKNLKRFEQKLRALMSLDDRRICNYADVVFADGKVILVLEPLVYESLEDLLSKTGHIGPERAVGIFSQVCEALEAAYKQDVMHRDIKPSNIGILDNQQFSDDVLVFDFGIAKIIAEESSEHKTEQYITRTRETFGSPLYLSPEQCGGKKIDNRSDIYSLGCVIYESLTGKPPFVGKNVLETAYKHMNDIQRPLGLDPSMEPISTRFEEVVSKCLAKDPDSRYQSPDELRNDLELIMSATDTEWTNSAFVYKETVVRKRKKRDKKNAGGAAGFGSRFSTEALVWSIGILSICGVVGFWSWIILKPESKKSYSFDNNSIWAVRLNSKPAQVEDFGNKEEAAKVNLQSIERDIGPNCREYADALLALVQLYHESQHWHDALTYGKKLTACTIRLEKDGQEGPGPLSDCYRLVAYAAFCAGENDEAIPAAEKSLELAVGKQSLNLSNIQCLRILGDIYSKQNNLSKAEDMFKRFFNLSELEKEQHPNVYWDACGKLGDIYRREGKFSDAERYYKLGLDWWRSHGNPETGWAPKALYGYGLTLYEAGKFKEAEEPLKEDRTLVRHSAQIDLGLKAAVRKLYIDALYHSNWFNALSTQLNDSDKD